MPLVTNRPLVTNMFGPCEKFKPDITKWLPSVREPFLHIARDVKSVNRDNPAGHAKDILFGFC